MNNILFGTITVSHFISLGILLFIIGMCGIFINRKSIITILMSIEIMLLAVNINFVTFSTIFQNYYGQIFTIFILTVAAAEAAIGLAILVVYFRNKGEIDIENMNKMKG